MLPRHVLFCFVSHPTFFFVGRTSWDATLSISDTNLPSLQNQDFTLNLSLLHYHTMKNTALLLLLALSASDAFVAINPSSQTSAARSSALEASPFNQDILPSVSSSFESPRALKSSLNAQSTTSVETTLPYSVITKADLSLLKTWELPKNAQPFRDAAARDDVLMEVEVTIGRIAMLSAAVFAFVEVTTGKSLPEQVSSWGIFS